MTFAHLWPILAAILALVALLLAGVGRLELGKVVAIVAAVCALLALARAP